jgi:hypothetical protein
VRPALRLSGALWGSLGLSGPWPKQHPRTPYLAESKTHAAVGSGLAGRGGGGRRSGFGCMWTSGSGVRCCCSSQHQQHQQHRRPVQAVIRRPPLYAVGVFCYLLFTDQIEHPRPQAPPSTRAQHWGAHGHLGLERSPRPRHLLLACVYKL